MSAPQEVLPWWESLDFLAPDVRQDLGRLIACLERGLSVSGPARTSDEPAGWSGLARRGSWNRLLPSEWALVEASPAEFARRADEGELCFWQPAYEQGESRHTVWVWVDVGPDQLGACRLVQIALLLWLQRAAMDSGGTFYWGSIQSPEKAYERLAAAEFKTYLDLRSLEVPDRAPERFPEMTVWCVGSPAWLAGLPKDFRRVALSQEDQTSVSLSEGPTRLRLPLPESRRAVRLLRDPFSWDLPGEIASSLGGEGRMAFSECGRKLLFVTDQAISTLPLPQSMNAPAGRLRTFPLLFPGFPVVGVSMQGAAISVVQAEQGSWSAYWLNPPQAEQRNLVTLPSSLPTPARLGTCWRHWPARWYVWVEGSLANLVDGAVTILEQTLGGTELGNSSVLVTGLGLVLNAFHQPLFTLDGELPLKVHSAPSYPLTERGVKETMACLMPNGLWRLCWLDRTEERAIDGEVLGVVRDELARPGLLAVREGKLSLHSSGPTRAVPLEGRIQEALLHPRGVMAYRTLEGDTGVYSFPLNKPIWVADR